MFIFFLIVMLSYNQSKIGSRNLCFLSIIDWCGSHHSNQRVKLRIFGNHKWKNKILEIVVFGNYCFLKGIWKHFAFKKVMWNRSPAEYAVLHWYMNMPCLLIYFYNPFFYFIDLKTWIKLLTLALNMKNIFYFIYLFIYFQIDK